MLGNAASALVARKYIVVLVVAVVAIILGLQGSKFEIDASADTLLTRDNEKYIRSKAVTDRFTPEEFLILAYEPLDHELLSKETFDDLRALSGEIGELERVRSVRSILNVPLLTLGSATSLDSLAAGEMTVNQAGFPMESIATALRGHPIYENLLVDPAQSVTALRVSFEPDPELRKIGQEITALELAGLSRELTETEHARLAELEAAEAPLEKALTDVRNREIETIREIVTTYDESANIYLGGVHVLGYQLIRIVKNDLLVFGVAIAVIVAFVLLALFRELRWILIAGICCAVSIACSLGAFGLLGLKATVISANFVALQLILTLALVVHLIVQYREYARTEPDWDHDRLIRETMVEKVPPSLYAGLTTAVGFGSLIVSGFQPVISFGWMMILAMGISIVVTLTLFPAMLAIVGGRTTIDETGFIRRLLGCTARVASTRKKLILVSAAAVLGVCAIGSSRLDVENSFIDYFSESTDVHRELSFIDEKLGGSTPLDIVYPAKAPAADLLLSADQLTTMQKLQSLLNEHEAVGKVMSLVNFTALARQINDGKPVTEYEMTAAWRIMDASVRESLLGSFFNPDTEEVRISLRIKDATPGLDRGLLLQSIDQDVRASLPRDAEYQLTNLFVLYQDILERLFRSQVLTLAVVLAALTLMFLLIFRSIRLALIAIVPNILVTATVFGVMGWFGIPLDLMTITIAAVAMGIAVDDTIHYVHRFRKESRDGDASGAVRRAHGSVGFAVLYTTLILAAGFASLVFSDFVPSILFGLLTALGLGAAVLYDLTVLPVLLARFAPGPSPVRSAA